MAKVRKQFVGRWPRESEMSNEDQMDKNNRTFAAAIDAMPDAVTAFANLRKVVGDAWDDIDPEQYVHELREGNMTHSEKCPICCGSGEYTPPQNPMLTGCPTTVTCHGCNGRGWVQVGSDRDRDCFFPIVVEGGEVRPETEAQRLARRKWS